MDQYTLEKLKNVLIEILDEFVRVCENNNLTYLLLGGTLLGAARHKGFIPWDDDIDVGMPRNDYEKFLDIYEKINNTDYYLVSHRSPDEEINIYGSFSKLCKRNTLYSKNKNIGIFIDIFPFDKCTHIFGLLQFKLSKSLWRIYRLKNNLEISSKNIIKLFIMKFICFFLSKHTIFSFYNKFCSLFNNFNTGYLIIFSGLYKFKNEIHKNNTVFPLTKLSFEGKLYSVPGNWDLYLKDMYGDYMELPPVEQRLNHNPGFVFFNLNDDC
jgi:lipopolysaccharide cholinephosphotransferase